MTSHDLALCPGWRKAEPGGYTHPLALDKAYRGGQRTFGALYLLSLKCRTDASFSN